MICTLTFVSLLPQKQLRYKYLCGLHGFPPFISLFTPKNGSAFRLYAGFGAFYFPKITLFSLMAQKWLRYGDLRGFPGFLSLKSPHFVSDHLKSASALRLYAGLRAFPLVH